MTWIIRILYLVLFLAFFSVIRSLVTRVLTGGGSLPHGPGSGWGGGSLTPSWTKFWLGGGGSSAKIRELRAIFKENHRIKPYGLRWTGEMHIIC